MNFVHLFENKGVVEDASLKGVLVEKGFGESKGRSLVLDLFETLFLLKSGKIVVLDKKDKQVGEKKIFSVALEGDKSFYSKFAVYSDLREKGYCVKTGLKFGFDFRVYPRGKKMGEEHSQYVIHVASESEKLSMPQLSRIARLSANLHTLALVAVIDSEDCVNYYSLERVLP